MTRLKRYSILMVAIITMLIVDIAVELTVMPRLYSPLPIPYPSTAKPIGAILLPVTFIHMTLLLSNILIVAYVASKAGFNVGGLLPRTRDGKIQTAFMLILMISGIFLIWVPIALLPFIVSGAYLVFVEIK